MRAATRVRIGSVGMFLVVLSIVLVLAGGFIRLKAAVELNDRIARSLNGVFELSVLTSDFVMYLEPRAETQWRAKYDTLEADFSTLVPSEDGVFSEDILASYMRVGSMFDLMVEARDDVASGTANPEISREYRERLAAQMLIEMQRTVTALTALGEDTSRAILSTMLTLLFAVSVVASIGVVLTFGNALITERDIARRLTELRTAAVHLGRGNLSYRTGIVSGSDEVTELASAFDEMADEIERAHVMLNQEIGQRREAETELSAYRDQLERLVEERTSELETANFALQAATEAKDRFLASMSHELRTPLNSIIGFTDIMLRGLVGDVTTEQAKQLGMVNASGKHLLVLINDMLDLSRIEAGVDRVVLESVDIISAVRLCIDTVRPMALEKTLDIELIVGGAVPEQLFTDHGKVRQILLNLLSNAVKFTDEGEVLVRIELSEATREIEVSVADTGIGISDESIDQVFEMFYQGPHPKHAKSPGTGMGLAISRRLAEMLGGSLTAGSGLDGGAVFTLLLPLEPQFT